jgi:ankyrin repeat protein
MSMAARLLTILLSITPFAAYAADQTSLDDQLFKAIADQDMSAIEQALQAGADINAREERGLQTPLMKSVLMGYDDLVKLFLEKGADV